MSEMTGEMGYRATSTRTRIPTKVKTAEEMREIRLQGNFQQNKDSNTEGHPYGCIITGVAAPLPTEQGFQLTMIERRSVRGVAVAAPLPPEQGSQHPDPGQFAAANRGCSPSSNRTRIPTTRTHTGTGPGTYCSPSSTRTRIPTSPHPHLYDKP